MTLLTSDPATAEQAAASLAAAPAFIRRRQERNFHPVTCGLALFATDCLAVSVATLLAAYGAGFFTHGDVMPARAPGLPIPLELAALFTTLIVYFTLKGRYGERIPFWTETHLVVSSSIFAAATEAVFSLLTGRGFEDRWAVAALLAFPVLAVPANRLVKHVLACAGLWMLPVVVIGDGPTVLEAEAALGSDRSLGYCFVGRIDPAVLMAEPATRRLRAVLARYRSEKVLIAIDSDGCLQRQLIECALRERVPFAVVPPPRALPAFDWNSTRLFSHDTTLLSFHDGLSRPMLRIVKAAIDVSAALVLLLLTSPLFFVLATAICLDGGPVFYAHRRVGTGGRPFLCLKFRTMVTNGDRILQELLSKDTALAIEWSQARKLVRDPRVTRVGRFLRRTSLDELPQLINVLRLEMSLVGPRPIVESEIPLYGEYIAHYYATRPGITGLWQVSGRSNTSYARRVQLDVWYVNNWSVWNDMAVLLKTVPAVLGRQGAH